MHRTDIRLGRQAAAGRLEWLLCGAVVGCHLASAGGGQHKSGTASRAHTCHYISTTGLHVRRGEAQCDPSRA